MEQRTALINRIRGLLSELGIMLPLQAATVRVTLPEGFQRSEFLMQKRAIDFISDRRELRKTIASGPAMLQRQPADAVG